LETYSNLVIGGLATDGTYIWEAGCRDANWIACRANGGTLE